MNIGFTENTIVNCERGFIPIQNIVAGDKVKTLSSIYTSVQAVNNHISDNSYTVRIEHRNPLYCGSDTRFYACKEYNGILSSPAFIPVTELTDRHYVYHNFNISKLPLSYMSINSACKLGTRFYEYYTDNKLLLTQNEIQSFILTSYFNSHNYLRTTSFKGLAVDIPEIDEKFAYVIATLLENIYHTKVQVQYNSKKKYCIRTIITPMTYYSKETQRGNWYKIKSVIPTKNKYTYYSLDIAEDNSYEVNGIICKN